MAGRHRESPTERRARRAGVTDLDEILAAAARFLEVRPRSVAEVRRRLVSGGYRAALVEGALDRLTSLGYLDDEAFARAWIESRDRARPRGERALRGELLARGVDRSVIDVVLAERAAPEPLPAAPEPSAAGAARSGGDGSGGDLPASGGPDATADEAMADGATADEAAAWRLLERHRRTLEREPDPARRRQKAYALLARHGFDPDVCREVAAGVTALPDES